MHRISTRLGIKSRPLARLAWLIEVLRHDPKRSVFIDESGFNLAMTLEGAVGAVLAKMHRFPDLCIRNACA